MNTTLKFYLILIAIVIGYGLIMWEIFHLIGVKTGGDTVFPEYYIADETGNMIAPQYSDGFFAVKQDAEEVRLTLQKQNQGKRYEIRYVGIKVVTLDKIQ